MLKRTKIEILFTFIVIPVLTLLLASFADMSEYNFSFIGNELEHRIIFDIWGISVGLFFHYQSIRIIEILCIDTKRLVNTIHLVVIMEIAAVLLPYNSQNLGFIDLLHEFLSVVSTVGFAILMYYIIYNTLINSYNNAKKYLVSFFMIQIVSIFIFMHYSHVNSVLEVFYTLSMCFYLFYIKHDLIRKISEV